MGKYTIEVVAKPVLRKIRRSSRQFQLGNQLAIRKKPHAIDVALEQNIRRSYWCIMLMVIYTMLTYAT
jgi:hypothetical protein